MPNVTTREIYHKFFHAPGGAKRERVNCPSNCHYEGNSFYSYRTEIGRIVKQLDGEPALLISEEYMSATTSKHVNGIYAACPWGAPISVPFEWGRIGMTYKEFAKAWSLLFREMKKTANVNRREDRWRIMNRWRSVNEFHARVHSLPAALLAIGKELDDVARKKQNEKASKQSEIFKKKNERLLAKWNEIKDLPYLERLIRALGEGHGFANSKDRAFVLKELQTESFQDMQEDVCGLGYIPSPAYVVPLNDATVETSLSVTMPVSVVKHELKRWLKGEVKEKTHILSYEIQLIRPSFVKIGCHVIPTKNLMALAEHYGLAGKGGCNVSRTAGK